MLTKKRKHLSQLEKLLSSQDSAFKHLERWLTMNLSHAIKHQAKQEKLASRVFTNCAILLCQCKKFPKVKEQIISMLGYPLEAKWTTFLDKLSTSQDQTMLTIQLLKTLVRESISNERAYLPFWTHAYRTLSEKLSLPTKTDCVGLDTNYWNPLSQKPVEVLEYLTVRQKSQVNRNSSMISWPSYTSSHVDKWESEATPTVKSTIRIRLYPNQIQRRLLDSFITTSIDIYNKALDEIQIHGHRPNFYDLRDLLVTQMTKKHHPEYVELTRLASEFKKSTNEADKRSISDKILQLKEALKGLPSMANPLINEREKLTPKTIKACTINQLCDAYKTAKTNLREGYIRSYEFHHRSHTDPVQTIEIEKSGISMSNGIITIFPTIFMEHRVLKISKKNIKCHRNLTIDNNVDIVRKNGKYFIHIIKTHQTRNIHSTASDVEIKPVANSVCGIDLGLRTFATVYSVNDKENRVYEYDHDRTILFGLNDKINFLKTKKKGKTIRRKETLIAYKSRKKKSYRKKQFVKLESKKTHYTHSLHFSTINHLLENNKIIYCGDIRSHNMVKYGDNPRNNQEFNDLKFYQFKQRLLYKARAVGTVVVLVPEHNTTKCCSNCGTLKHDLGGSKVYNCVNCVAKFDRDENSAKNILLKGVLS